MTTKVVLTVNDSPVALDYFVQSLIDHVVRGILEALEGTSEPKIIDLSIVPAGVNLKVNGTAVPTNPFVSRVIQNTLFGLVSSLKGVSQITTLRVEIKK
jgi:uncharacterized membrane protein HdeD (DUF308 family)